MSLLLPRSFHHTMYPLPNAERDPTDHQYFLGLYRRATDPSAHGLSRFERRVVLEALVRGHYYDEALECLEALAPCASADDAADALVLAESLTRAYLLVIKDVSESSQAGSQAFYDLRPLYELASRLGAALAAADSCAQSVLSERRPYYRHGDLLDDWAELPEYGIIPEVTWRVAYVAAWAPTEMYPYGYFYGMHRVWLGKLTYAHDFVLLDLLSAAGEFPYMSEGLAAREAPAVLTYFEQLLSRSAALPADSPCEQLLTLGKAASLERFGRSCESMNLTHEASTAFQLARHVLTTSPCDVFPEIKHSLLTRTNR